MGSGLFAMADCRSIKEERLRPRLQTSPVVKSPVELAEQTFNLARTTKNIERSFSALIDSWTDLKSLLDNLSEVALLRQGVSHERDETRRASFAGLALSLMVKQPRDGSSFYGL
jgi:dynactin complex subunit